MHKLLVVSRQCNLRRALWITSLVFWEKSNPKRKKKSEIENLLLKVITFVRLQLPIAEHALRLDQKKKKY
jgi:hypothetical protein